MASVLPGCSFRRRFLHLFESPAKSFSSLILVSLKLVDVVEKRVTWRRAARSPVAIIAKPPDTWCPTATWTPSVGCVLRLKA